MFRRFLMGAWLALWAGSGWADCQTAAVTAARAEHIPQNVMLALVRIEAQQGFLDQPTPWRISLDGDLATFDTGVMARHHLRNRLAGPARQVRVGCFGVIYDWQPGQAALMHQVLDPARNAQIAAAHLATLRQNTPDWAAALTQYALHGNRPVRRMTPLRPSLPGLLPWPGDMLDDTPAPRPADEAAWDLAALDEGLF